MKNRMSQYAALLFGILALLVTGSMNVSASDKDLPDIQYLIQIAQMTSGWTTPPMGGPQQRYIKDISTGKTYLVEVDYWGEEVVLAEH